MPANSSPPLLTAQRFLLFAAPLALVLARAGVIAQTIQPPYDSSYSFRSLGAVPGVPSPYGGLTFKHDDNDVLLIGGDANRSAGGIYAIRVTRAANGAITGFSGTAMLHASAPFIDGGLQYGPSNVLFFTRYNVSEVGQIKVGSSAPDRIDLVNLGASCGALTLVPPGFPGAGRFKISSWAGGRFHDARLQPDTSGTFDIVGLTHTATLVGGPEGFLYVPPGSVQFPDYTQMLVCEFSGGAVSVLTLDSNGDPIPATRAVFMAGLSGAQGAAIDPQSGGFLFSTFSGGGQIIVVDGFSTCGGFSNYGSGIAGSGGNSPSIRGSGCASFNRAINFQTGSGPANAVGAMNIGFRRLSIPLFGGFVLTDPAIPITHQLDGTGSWTTTLNTPNDPNLVGRHIYFQAVYFDRGARFGVTASYGLDMLVR